MSQEEEASKEEWTAVRCEGFDDMRTQNIRFWQAQGGAAIRKAAWEMVVEAWELQKNDPNELRFQRHVTVARRA